MHLSAFAVSMFVLNVALLLLSMGMLLLLVDIYIYIFLRAETQLCRSLNVNAAAEAV